jgi:hypothetical protein
MENPPDITPIDKKYPRQKQGKVHSLDKVCNGAVRLSYRWSCGRSFLTTRAMTENIKMAIEPSNIVLFVE